MDVRGDTLTMTQAEFNAYLAAVWDEGYDRAESDHYGTGFWTQRLRANPHRDARTEMVQRPRTLRGGE